MKDSTLRVLPKFRRIPKGPSRGQIPVDLEEEIRLEAHNKRTSFAAILTLAVARGMNKNPSDYGLVIEDSQAQ